MKEKTYTEKVLEFCDKMEVVYQKSMDRLAPELDSPFVTDEDIEILNETMSLTHEAIELCRESVKEFEDMKWKINKIYDLSCKC